MQASAEFRDDDLTLFASEGPPPLPPAADEGYVENDGARIRYASHGTGPAVILLHGGLGHGGNWNHQVPALLAAGYRAVLIDSRGHGRSTRDARPYSYERMGTDVLAVMDHLGIGKAAFVGWSDGACIALILGHKHPDRVAGVFYFACNMDPSGTLPFKATPALDHCFARHTADYAALSATPDNFKAFAEAVGLMQRTEPNYTASDLAEIDVPVLVIQGEHEEFIRPEHAKYLAETVPRATLEILPGVSHFAPLQRPALFNAAMLAFLKQLPL